MGGVSENDIIKERFHSADPRWSRALGKDLMCRTCVKKNRDAGTSKKLYEGLDAITIDDVQDFWIHNNPHGIVEAHLPADTPLEYAELIVVGKPVNEHITKEIKLPIDSMRTEYLNELFKMNGESIAYKNDGNYVLLEKKGESIKRTEKSKDGKIVMESSIAKNNDKIVIKTKIPKEGTLARDFIEEHIGDKCKLVFTGSRKRARDVVFNYLKTKVPDEGPCYFVPPPPESGDLVRVEEPERPIDNLYHTGFTFTLTSSRIRELFIPVVLNEESDRIYFVASGNNFYLSLSNIGNTMTTSGKRKSITFRMGTGKDVTVYNESPLEGNFKEGDCHSSFNNSAIVSGSVFYTVHVDNANRLVTLSHWGPSKVFSDEEVKVPIGDERLRYFSFSIIENENRTDFPKIMNLFVTKDLPPEDPKPQKPANTDFGASLSGSNISASSGSGSSSGGLVISTSRNKINGKGKM